MPSKTVQVGSEAGLSRGPATIIAEATEEFDALITLSMDGDDGVDASSMTAIMALGAEMGDEVTVESSDDEAVDVIAALIERDLDE